MPKFEDIEVGDIAELQHQVTLVDIDRFVELTGDDNRLHTDVKFAEQTSFKKPVAHGMLGASFISTIIGTKLPGDGALWFSQSLEFLLPVRVGDVLSIRAEVLAKIDRQKIIELQTDIFNQHRQKVTTGIAKVKVVEIKANLTAPTPQQSKSVALVIGGSGGIGTAIARKLAADGCDVAIHYFKNGSEAQSVANEIKLSGCRSLAVQADIDSVASVSGMIDIVNRKLGSISHLIFCATAKTTSAHYSKLIWKDFDDHLSITIRGLFNLIQYVVPLMESANYGKIILISSQYVDAPASNLIPYITAKAALVGFGRSLALELAPKGICVNIVSPSMTDTALIADVPERIRLLTAASTPLRRLALPEDVAGAVSFLASPNSNFLAGETIRVNGGQVML